MVKDGEFDSKMIEGQQKINKVIEGIDGDENVNFEGGSPMQVSIQGSEIN
jgi:hypothetical protein